jgi:putative sterol carrier protein
VARFLSPAWADQLNAALASGSGGRPDPDGGLATLDGTFTVVQEVRDTPDGDLRVVLRVVDGAMTISLIGSDGTESGRAHLDGVVDANVTIVLSYADSVAMSKGELSPAEALNGGRIRVRGDLSVLVAAQQMLLAAHTSTQQSVEATTY